MKRIGIALTVMLAIAMSSIPARAGVQEASGRITLLRVHEVGTKYGPATDQIDVEVIVWLDRQPGRAFGFQLRNDANGPAHQDMLGLLQQAFDRRETVTIDYDQASPERKNSLLFRVWVTK